MYNTTPIYTPVTKETFDYFLSAFEDDIEIETMNRNLIYKSIIFI